MVSAGRAALVLLAHLLALLGCALPTASADDPAEASLPGPVGEPSGPWRDQMHRVPVTLADGSVALIGLRLCRPGTEPPAPLAVLNHGSPPRAADRPTMRPAGCEAEPVQWFLRRGYAVALPLRRGYGAAPGTRWAEGYGSCDAPDFRAAGLATAHDIAAALRYGLAQPGIRATGAVVVGHSAGGWGTIALAGQPPPGAAALVNMAGGRGGWAGGTPGANCSPDALVRDAGRFGETARGVPMLWLYSASDSFFSPSLAAAMHARFTAAGGRADLQALPEFGRDGHFMFHGREGSLVWGPILERYLAGQGLPGGAP